MNHFVGWNFAPNMPRCLTRDRLRLGARYYHVNLGHGEFTEDCQWKMTSENLFDDQLYLEFKANPDVEGNTIRLVNIRLVYE